MAGGTQEEGEVVLTPGGMPVATVDGCAGGSGKFDVRSCKALCAPLTEDIAS